MRKHSYFDDGLINGSADLDEDDNRFGTLDGHDEFTRVVLASEQEGTLVAGLIYGLIDFGGSTISDHILKSIRSLKTIKSPLQIFKTAKYINFKYLSPLYITCSLQNATRTDYLTNGHEI